MNTYKGHRVEAPHTLTLKINGRINKEEDICLFQTPACDLQSLFAFKLKRKMLLSLLKKDLYPDDPVKREDVYNTYKKYLGTVSLLLNHKTHNKYCIVF
jgi:hypothetical protein